VDTYLVHTLKRQALKDTEGVCLEGCHLCRVLIVSMCSSERQLLYTSLLKPADYKQLINAHVLVSNSCVESMHFERVSSLVDLMRTANRATKPQLCTVLWCVRGA